MSTPVRLLGFVAIALAVFGAAAGIGKAVGPIETETESHGHAESESAGHAGHGVEGGQAETLPGGLTVSSSGHTLELATESAPAGQDRELAFTITDAHGNPVTDYDTVHEKQLHLIAVRRDLSGFQHVHPTLDEHGTWRTELDLTPGTWRIFADFSADGIPLTLGADLQVAGDFEPVDTVAESRTAEVDGYEVRLTGDLAAGGDAALTLTISKEGEPVTDLQPYLGAYGHLVALRAGDLAYLHVHPEEGEAGPEVVFHASVPSVGRYHLFLDFRHDGVVRTAAFTLSTRGAAPAAPHEEQEDHDDSHAH